jgi:Flp pilus assembly pilin Flp
MLNFAKQFIVDEDGLEMVEWAIVAALITTAGATAIASVGTEVANKFQDLVTAVSVT